MISWGIEAYLNMHITLQLSLKCINEEDASLIGRISSISMFFQCILVLCKPTPSCTKSQGFTVRKGRFVIFHGLVFVKL
jgi:hypothetical protein